MKLKDQLLLQEVAGQYVMVPIGQRAQEVTSIVYTSFSGAFLWDGMKDHDFQPDNLVDLLLEHYDGVNHHQVSDDVKPFLKVLSDNCILDDGAVRGRVFVKILGWKGDFLP